MNSKILFAFCIILLLFGAIICQEPLNKENVRKYLTKNGRRATLTRVQRGSWFDKGLCSLDGRCWTCDDDDDDDSEEECCNRCGSRSSSGCFPSTAIVHLENGETVKISDLRIGDRVQTVSSDENFDITHSEVRAFVTKEHNVINVYKSLTVSGNNTISLTRNHLIYAQKNYTENFKPIYANYVAIGDRVLIHENTEMVPATVINISTIKIQGVYVPLTMEGTIIVDKILASCYASFDHDLAHLAMIPVYWFPDAIKWIFDEVNRIPNYVNIIKDFGRYLLPHEKQF